MNAYPRLPDFEYVKPGTINEASQFLITHAGKARPFLGGTDLFVQMRDRALEPNFLVDIKGIEGMNEIEFDPSDGLTIGAAVNMNQVIAHPEVEQHYQVLSASAQSVASYQLRTRASIVGNICNASPAGDTIGACLLLDGELAIHGEEGRREEKLRDFFKGPGQTSLNVGDIVTLIHFPVPPDGLKGKYIKLGRNKASDLAIVGVTAIGYPDDGRPSGFCVKLALASVAPTPLVVDQVEEILSQGQINEELLADAAQAAMDASSPIDDVRGSARYRKHMVRNLSFRALMLVWAELNQ